MTAPTPAEPDPAVGGWQFSLIPKGWTFDPQLGLRCTSPGMSASIQVAEELLPSYTNFDQYVESQLTLMRRFLPNPVISGPEVLHFPSCSAAKAVGIRYMGDSGKIVIQAQIYVLVNDIVGIATFTSMEEHMASVRPVFDIVKKTISFHPEPRKT